VNISQVLIVVPGACYLGVCCNEVYRGNYAMAVVYFGYALANCGLYAIAAK